MKNLSAACAILLLVTSLAVSGQAAEAKAGNPFIHRTAADGTVRFELKERIRHPHFWWPRTLLNYHVVLTGAAAPAERWILTENGSDAPVPLQVSDLREKDGRVVSGTVSFFFGPPDWRPAFFRAAYRRAARR